MSDLRKYINLVDIQLDLNERKLRIPGATSPSAPKVGAEAVGKDGLTYQWMGRQWVQKAGQPGGKGRMATATTGQQLTAKELQSRGNILTRIVKKNPKVSAALAAIVGIKAGGTLAGGDSAEVQPQANTVPPAQGSMDAGNAPGTSSQTASSQDLTAMKAEIDALIKELESSNSADVKKELERIKRKLNPKPARWSDNPSII